MFQIIMEECAKRNLYPDPKYLHLDFESAVIEAAKEVIGKHINVRGCFYHLCQSTFRKVQELGLATMYKRDEEFRKHCGMVDALAFLPLQLVEEGMTYLKNNLPENLMDLLDYFDAYYVSGKYRRIGNEENNIRFRRLPHQLTRP
uniref:MULE transposase domain-containing protein n=1 Tax=Schizaphis graminum TaxID=13262 RepID=A0A2S2NEM4_SCHGA